MNNSSGLLDLYIDYLIASTSYTTATGMARMLNNKISHNKITRFLSKSSYQPSDLWKISKKVVKSSDKGYLIVDDSISEQDFLKLHDKALP